MKTTEFDILINDDNTFLAVKNEVGNIIKNNRLIDDRINQLKELGINCINRAVGSGGVGTVRIQRNGVVTMQISYGKSNWNYAWLAEIGYFRKNENNPIQHTYFL